MKIEKVVLEELRGKYYSTEIVAYTEGHDPTYISIVGYGNGKPSQRELDRGYNEDYGMDHVESDSSYQVALKILEALK